MPAARELQMDPVVDETLAVHALAGARVAQQVDDIVLEHAGANALLDVVAAPVLEHDRVDPRVPQQQRQRQPGRAGADDRDLGPQRLQRAASNSAA